MAYNSKNNKVYVIGINGDASTRRRLIYVVNPDTITIDYTYNVLDSKSEWLTYALDPNSGDLILIIKDTLSVEDESTYYLKFTSTYSSSSARTSPYILYSGDIIARANGSEFLGFEGYKIYKYPVVSSGFRKLYANNKYPGIRGRS
ncbi:hypothetical protein [Thermotalea metallivorans]|uniref:hypothetical protein n=1 Tax=Thermotalea metallivorans TaxID=520762 RepID=UPI0012EE9ED9|nr:hypothetical protein [Thermotalea metallivorans]